MRSGKASSSRFSLKDSLVGRFAALGSAARALSAGGALRLALSRAFPYEIFDHFLRDIEIRDDPVPQGAHGDDVRGGLAEHALGFKPEGDRLPGVPVDRHDGGFFQHDPLPLDVDEGVGRAEVNPHVVRE